MTDAFAHLSSGFPPHGEGNGGDEGNRTLDPLLAGQVLSQLSYTPEITIILLGYDNGLGFI